MGYAMKLKEVEKLVGKSNATLFDRVKILCEVYSDPEFMAFHSERPDAAEEHLDSYLGDYGISFADARLMLRYFSTRREWETGNIRQMLGESLDRGDGREHQHQPQDRNE